MIYKLFIKKIERFKITLDHTPKLLLALVIGTSGGAIFFVSNLPLPWMLGSMTAATIASISGAPIKVPPIFRNCMVAILGVLLGTQFTPGIFSDISNWYAGIIGVIISIIIMMFIGIIILRYIGKYDSVTAFFSAIPGGLSEMILVGNTFGGDDKKIAISHAARVLTAVFLIAFYFRLFESYEPTANSILTQNDFNLSGILILIGCAFIGYPFAMILRIPASQLVGPLVLSAGFSLTGLVNTALPEELVIISQIILGAAIGARFAGSAFCILIKPLLLSVLVGIIMVSCAGLIAFILGKIIGAPSSILFLALAPGGLAEMSIIALSMNADSAFVSSHHVLRIAILVIVAPIIFRCFSSYKKFKNK